MSRIPVREALQILAAEGLVSLASGATAVVTQMSVTELQELYEMREALEPVMTSLATPNLGRAELIQLRRCIVAMREAEMPSEFLSANAAFHEIIAGAANRPRMAQTVQHLRKLTDRYLHLNLEVLEDNVHILTEHVQIVEAFEAGDAAGAAAVTRQHLETAHNFILRYMLDNPALERADGSRDHSDTHRLQGLT